MLRPYQQEAHDAAIAWVRVCLDPCLIEAATGAGKSHIVAALAETLTKMSGGKKVICLQPSKELVEQNYEKFLATGQPASIYSASVGRKCTRHKVVFATPGTLKKAARRMASDVCAVIVDECHETTPTIVGIIDALRESGAPNLRVIGLTATPYRLGRGYIYATDEDGNPVNAHEPYYTRRVYSIQARMLIKAGFLTPPVIGATSGEHYETAGLKINEMDRAFEGHGRKTAAIIADVVHHSRDRKGVMIFAQTIQHAKECMASLPPSLSAMVTGETKKEERAYILRRFKARELKYIVNVAVLTRGFDASHVDVIAILRATDSVSLLQQIIGRGLRIDPQKADCLVLDYAENIDRHCPDGDVFAPVIKVLKPGEAEPIRATCPDCGTQNQFGARKNTEGYEIDENGYYTDLMGNRIATEFGPMPAHYGRRCQGLIKARHTHIQCGYRWTCKKCEACGEDNDIAARYCRKCKHELVDPNEKLRMEQARFYSDPTNVQTEAVVHWQVKPSMSRAGNEIMRVEFTTARRSFCVYYTHGTSSKRAQAQYNQANDATHGFTIMPRTVTYRKDPETTYYSTFGFNDEIPAMA